MVVDFPSLGRPANPNVSMIVLWALTVFAPLKENNKRKLGFFSFSFNGPEIARAPQKR